MLRKFVCVGFHPFQGDGAASWETAAMKINALRDIDSIVDASRFDSSNPGCESPGPGLINQAPTVRDKIRLNVRKKSILLPKQTHPGCSSRPLKSELGAAPPLERGLHRGCFAAPATSS
jgi:hypothetical protein